MATAQEIHDRIEREAGEYETKMRKIELAKERVKKTMRHYSRMAVEAKGYKWDSDCTAEIDCMVDDIFDTMKGL